ncbi:MAG: hypothetical protein J0M02_05015 [Planctomycetes bacterium]|nr:hypothetical protein [Planctomycetota bacterium]
MRAVLRLLAVASCVGALPAVEGLMAAFDPRPMPERIAWRASAEAGAQAEADDRDGSGALAFDRESAALSWLGLRGEADEVWLRGQAQHIGITGDAQLASGASPAGDYYEFTAMGMWKHRLGDGDLVGGMANLKRDGQAPLTRGMEWGANATLFGRVGLGADGADGLLLALNYDADRIYFGSLPLMPMVAWQGVRGPWVLLVGAPFSMITYRAEDWKASAVVGPLPSLSADHRLHGPLRAMAEVRWAKLQMRRMYRAEHDDRLTLSQWETSCGLRLEAGPAIGCDLLLGIATARRLGEDDQDADARRDGIALEPAPFAAFRGRIAF